MSGNNIQEEDEMNKEDAGEKPSERAIKGVEAIDMIMAELEAAEEKHPHWPGDIVHAVAIMVEEAGESMQAALDIAYKGKGTDQLKLELAQTAAMCLRIFINIQ